MRQLINFVSLETAHVIQNHEVLIANNSLERFVRRPGTPPNLNMDAFITQGLSRMRQVSISGDEDSLTQPGPFFA